MDMRALGKIVSSRPLATLIVVLLITSVFAYYASQMEMSADMGTFLPDDEMVKAQYKVSEDFGDTDIVQVIYTSDNVLTRSSLLDMLKIQYALENDSYIVDNLKTPESPEESIISPADIIVIGNITLSFEGELITLLNNMSDEMKNLNFTLIMLPINYMNSLMVDYADIYNNATEIRDDAKDIVLLLFTPPGEGGDMEQYMPIMENLTAVLMGTDDFSLKSRVLTILTPPVEALTPNETAENPLMNYFIGDMDSNLSLQDKGVSIHYFSLTNDFTHHSLNYSQDSLSSAISANQQLIYALNNVKGSILNGDNDTALYIMNQTIDGVSSQINSMAPLVPYYQDFNRSLTTFMVNFTAGTLTPQDVESVRENISTMLSLAQGDFRDMLEIFNSTFNTWVGKNFIFYDTLYQANATQQVCQGFIENYNSMLMLNYSLTDIKMSINTDSTGNTTGKIDALVNMLNDANDELEQQKSVVDSALESLETPYAQWYTKMLKDVDYTMGTNIAPFSFNIFNYTLHMQPQNSTEGGSFTAFYSLKHAFDSSVSDVYKMKIQNLFLGIMNMAKIGEGMEGIEMPIPESPSLEFPDMNPSVGEKMDLLENMSQEDILNTVRGIENYDPSNLTSTLNSTLPTVENVSQNMSLMSSKLKDLVRGIEFVYNTTGEENVNMSLSMYREMYLNVSNASMAMEDMVDYLPHISGFTYMMEQFSGQLNLMFSKDFDGTSAKASMMIIMLNDTYLPGESDAQHSNRMEALESRVGEIATSTDVNGKVMVMGNYLISKATEKTANETMTTILPAAMILVVIILLITFRSILDTLLGILGLGMAIAWAYGYGVIMDYSFNQISTTVAVLLVGLGIDYAIHTILRYREELRKGLDVRSAMREMITHLGMGLVLATITTIIAFLSNISSPIPPVQDFGVMNAVGIFGAFIIFTTAIPALKIIIDEWRVKRGKLKIKKEKEREGSGLIYLNKFLALGAMGAEKHRTAVLLVVLLITGMSIYGGMNIGTTFDLKDFLPDNLEISDTINFMMDNFNSSGMNDNYVLIEGNISTPQALKAVEETMENMKDDTYVDLSQSTSVTTLIAQWKERNRTFAKMVGENDTDGDGLPDSNITAIYNWLYDNANGNTVLHRANGTYDSMLIIVRSSASTDKENKVLMEELDQDIKPLKDIGLKATLTGTNLLTFHILEMLTGSQWNSLMITIIATLIVLTIVFFYERRSLALGVITSLPVVLALLWLLGSMYFLGINFNVVTVTITSLTIGLGITYAIHITHRFLEDWDREESIEEAIRKTVRHTGTSIFGAAATTMAGFGTLMLSSMPPIREFGEISALSILYSFVLSVFILPSFLYIWASRREKNGKI